MPYATWRLGIVPWLALLATEEFLLLNFWKRKSGDKLFWEFRRNYKRHWFSARASFSSYVFRKARVKQNWPSHLCQVGKIKNQNNSYLSLWKRITYVTFDCAKVTKTPTSRRWGFWPGRFGDVSQISAWVRFEDSGTFLKFLFGNQVDVRLKIEIIHICRFESE